MLQALTGANARWVGPVSPPGLASRAASVSVVPERKAPNPIVVRTLARFGASEKWKQLMAFAVGSSRKR